MHDRSLFAWRVSRLLLIHVTNGFRHDSVWIFSTLQFDPQSVFGDGGKRFENWWKLHTHMTNGLSSNISIRYTDVIRKPSKPIPRTVIIKYSKLFEG